MPWEVLICPGDGGHHLLLHDVQDQHTSAVRTNRKVTITREDPPDVIFSARAPTVITGDLH